MAVRVAKGWGRTKPPPGTAIDWSHPLGHGLIGAWPFNDSGVGSSGGRIVDATGLSVGAYTGTQAMSPGPFGNAPIYNGTSQLATLNSTVNRLRVGSTGTLSLWWRFNQSLSGINHFIFNAQISSTQSFGILKYTDANFYVGWYDNAEFRAVVDYTTLGLVQGRWYHLAVSFRNGTATKFFIDANLKATAGGSQNVTTTIGSTLVQVGYESIAGTPYYSACQVDNIRIYDKDLSQAQIREIYTDPWAGYYPPRRKLISPTAAAPSAEVLLPGRVGYSRFVSR